MILYEKTCFLLYKREFDSSLNILSIFNNLILKKNSKIWVVKTFNKYKLPFNYIKIAKTCFFLTMLKILFAISLKSNNKIFEKRKSNNKMYYALFLLFKFIFQKKKSTFVS